MIALKYFGLTNLHMRKFIVDRFELHFAKSAGNLKIRKDVWMALTEVISECKRWYAVEDSQVEGTSKGSCVINHHVMFALVFRDEF